MLVSQEARFQFLGAYHHNIISYACMLSTLAEAADGSACL